MFYNASLIETLGDIVKNTGTVTYYKLPVRRIFYKQNHSSYTRIVY